MSAQEQSEQSDQKLLIVIASDSDADSLIQKLVQRGYPATKVSSTGGFLRRGNATIFSGVDAEDVDNVIAIIRTECQARTEFLPAQALPFPESLYPAEPGEGRGGGARAGGSFPLITGGRAPASARLRSLEALYADDEDDGAAGPHLHRLRRVDALRERQRLRRQELRPRLALAPDDRDDVIDVFGVYAGEDGGVASSQEAAGAAHLGRGVAALHQLLDEPVRVRIRRDDDKELLV